MNFNSWWLNCAVNLRGYRPNRRDACRVSTIVGQPVHRYGIRACDARTGLPRPLNAARPSPSTGCPAKNVLRVMLSNRDYRRGVGATEWHWNWRCSFWPSLAFETALKIPPAKEICKACGLPPA
jgi:hypothetical protein